MVHVYWAEIPDGERKPGLQSKWAHRLLETALKRQYPEIDSIFLERDAKGKPFLPEHPGIHINLSHSGRYAACAIGEKPVGIDVECHKGRKRRDLVVKKFHPKEQRAYEMASEDKRELLFYELWVLKESFMKAEGSGLGIPLNSFYMEEVYSGEGQVRQSRNDRSYYYKLYPFHDRALSLAVCSEEAVFSKEPIQISFEALQAFGN